MKGTFRLLMVLTATFPLGLRAQGIADIARTLRDLPSYQAEATLSVTLPQTDTDVAYTLGLSSMSVPADTLAPASYLIDWSLPTPTGVSEGFTAYFDGNLYRYRDSRLQEYHTEWDSIPFRVTAPGGGVQRSAQFASLLPQFIGTEIEAMMADPRYTLSLDTAKRFDGRDVTEVTAIMTVGGETVQERRYLLDPVTALPLRTVTESNPSSISEQTIIVDYKPASAPEKPQRLTEELLVARYPEIFEKYRENNFRIENLRESPLPTFALPTLTGERHVHHRGEPFRQPTVIAIIDPATGSFNDRVISDIRTALDSATAPADAIFAFATTNADLAEETAGRPRPGETMLLNARSLARDCGATALPVVIISDAGGTVRNVVLGYNKDLSEIVLQSLELL